MPEMGSQSWPSPAGARCYLRPAASGRLPRVVRAGLASPAGQSFREAICSRHLGACAEVRGGAPRVVAFHRALCRTL
eukprot:666812-Pyramimonas_sp.AAC.1